MEPLKGRLDFPFPAMSADLGRQVERRINEEIEKAHETARAPSEDPSEGRRDD